MIKSLEYYKCLAIQKNWQSLQSTANWVKYAQKILEKYLRLKDWDQVQLSNNTLGEGI